MRYTIIAVGKLKERFWQAACDEYLKRLAAYGKVSIIQIPDSDPARCGGKAAVVEREGDAILAALAPRDHVVLLDIAGRERSSEQIAGYLDELALSGVGEVTFVIGGSWGVSEDVRKRANERLSFGPITLPHNLARVVLLEQIYRACRISRNEPYHK